jgi:cell division cycle protein 37
VHPNVDKRSFIRAKQNQIHQERHQRKHQIETLKYEQILNNGFLRRIDALLTTFLTHKAEAESRDPSDLMFLSIMQSANPSDDTPPPRPEGIHSQDPALPSYSSLMATLVDQVKEEVSKIKSDNLFDAYVVETKKHIAKVQGLQQELATKLAELQKEEGRKITSESIHVGFNSSSVAKHEDKKPEPTPAAAPSKKGKEKVQAVEVLNPHSLQTQTDNPERFARDSSGADADIDETASDDDEDPEPTELGKAFSQIKLGDYRACLQFISQNPQVLAERETDGLLVMAFNNQLDGRGEFARQCVHHALLLQYCRSLGQNGVGLFFKRITTPGHQAQKVFSDDVNETYNRIRTRAKEIKAQGGLDDSDKTGGVEQIQLHAVDPGTTINITIPPESSEDPAEQHARQLFEAFSPGLRRALQSGSLDEVNKVLGKMSVEEAEEIVAQLSEVCNPRSSKFGFLHPNHVSRAAC